MAFNLLAAGSLLGGLFGASSAKKAAAAQADATREATELQREIYYDQIDRTEGQREIGNNALAALASQYGLGPAPTFGGSAPYQINEINDAGAVTQEPIYLQSSEAEGELLGYRDVTGPGSTRYGVGDQTFNTREGAQDYLDGLDRVGGTTYENILAPDLPDTSMSAFEAAPGYQFRLDEGMKAIERGASARGLRLSGGTMKDFMRFGQGQASNEYGAFYGRQVDDYNRQYGAYQDSMNALRSLAGVGQTATQAQNNAGSQFATSAGNNLLAGGQAQAQGYTGVSNAVNGTINSLGGLYGLQQSGYFAT